MQHLPHVGGRNPSQRLRPRCRAQPRGWQARLAHRLPAGQRHGRREQRARAGRPRLHLVYGSASTDGHALRARSRRPRAAQTRRGYRGRRDPGPRPGRSGYIRFGPNPRRGTARPRGRGGKGRRRGVSVRGRLGRRDRSKGPLGGVRRVPRGPPSPPGGSPAPTPSPLTGPCRHRHRGTNLEHAAASAANLVQAKLPMPLLAPNLFALAAPETAWFGVHPCPC